MLIGVVAQPILAGDKDHGSWGDLGHEGCIVVGPAHHALGGCSQSISRLLNGIQDLQHSRLSETALYSRLWMSHRALQVHQLRS